VNELIRKARTKINNKGSVSDEEDEEALEYEFDGLAEATKEGTDDPFAIKKLDFKGDTTTDSEEIVDEDEKAAALEDVKGEIADGFDNV
jgi:GTP cyclohydrolase III